MSFFRLIAVVIMLGVVWVVGGLLWSMISPATSRVDEYASARIRRECGWQTSCKIKASELFEGKWDTVYLFAAGVTQQEIDAVLGPGKVRAGDLQRIFVLESDHRILRAGRAPGAVEKPFDGEIEFEDDDHDVQRMVRYSSDQWLRVIKFPIQPEGHFYVLTPTDEH